MCARGLETQLAKRPDVSRTNGQMQRHLKVMQGPNIQTGKIHTVARMRWTEACSNACIMRSDLLWPKWSIFSSRDTISVNDQLRHVEHLTRMHVLAAHVVSTLGDSALRPS